MNNLNFKYILLKKNLMIRSTVLNLVFYLIVIKNVFYILLFIGIYFNQYVLIICMIINDLFSIEKGKLQ